MACDTLLNGLSIFLHLRLHVPLSLLQIRPHHVYCKHNGIWLYVGDRVTEQSARTGCHLQKLIFGLNTCTGRFSSVYED